MPATPYLDLDLTVVSDRYRALARLMPELEIAYAVKANPHPAVLQLLAELGASFDVASAAELRSVLACDVDPARIEYSHPIKSPDDLAYAWQSGVRRFTADDPDEIFKISRHCPGARILIRIEVDHHGAAWPLADKFGTTTVDAVTLLGLVRDHDLIPGGVAFHVGSQQRNPRAFTRALEQAAQVARQCAELDITIDEVNIGGGLPSFMANDGVSPLEDYVDAIRDGKEGLSNVVRLVAEPGRYLVADAGQLHTQVMGTATRGGQLWVYLDAGFYHGLGETGAIGTRFSTNASGDPVLAVLAGPTCDSVDVLFDRQPQLLPDGITAGDAVVFHGAGAYTLSTATTFNGFPAPSVRVRHIPEP